MGLAGVAQIVRIHCHTQEVRQGRVIKETDDVRFAVTSYWPEEAAPHRLLQLARDHWSIKMDSTTAGIGPRTRTAAQSVTPSRHAISPYFGLWLSFCSSGKPRAKAAKKRCPTLSATFTASLGG
jgi:hypothetical protein